MPPFLLHSLLFIHCADQMADCCLKAGQQGFFWPGLGAGWEPSLRCRLFIVRNFSSSSALPGSHNSKSTLMVSTCTNSIYFPTDFRSYSPVPRGEQVFFFLLLFLALCGCVKWRPFGWSLFPSQLRATLHMTIWGRGLTGVWELVVGG